MTEQQRPAARQALDELLRHGPLDIGGDVTEQRAIFHEMIASAPLPEDVSAKPGELGGVPVVTVQTPARSRPIGRRSSTSTAAPTPSARRPTPSAWPPTSPGASGPAPSRSTTASPPSTRSRPPSTTPWPPTARCSTRALPAASIAFVGESAGGGLVAATLVALKDAGLPQPSSAAVFSPWADLTVSGASAASKADLDPALTPEALRTRARDYLGEHDPATPLASPIFADLTGLPPLLIQVGSHEILLDDAVRLAARAAEHDVPVELQVWPEVPHVFQGFAALLDDADRALHAAAAFIKRNWAG